MQKYYIEVILQELRTTATYTECGAKTDDLIKSHVSFTPQVQVPVDMWKLPGFYWMPKLHKNPYGCRFIASSNKCTTKPISKLLVSCLKMVSTHYQQYCAGIERNSGAKRFWIIGNTSEALL